VQFGFDFEIGLQGLNARSPLDAAQDRRRKPDVRFIVKDRGGQALRVCVLRRRARPAADGKSARPRRGGADSA
jgi:hypothetical protein